MDCLIVHAMSVSFATIGKHGLTLTVHDADKMKMAVWYDLN